MPAAPILQPPDSQAAIHLAWAARLMASPTSQVAATAKPRLAGRNAALRPLPQLAAADRADLDGESRMRLAVALDVICSATRKLGASAEGLEEATRAWLSLRGRQLLAADLEQLIEQARSPQATARARISGDLADTLAAAYQRGLPAEQETYTPVPATTPHSVALAHRTIEAAGEVVVAEMTLWLTNRDTIDYRRG